MKVARGMSETQIQDARKDNEQHEGSNSLLIDGLDAIREILKEADYQDCFLGDDQIVETIKDTVNLAQSAKKLLADIKAWDVQNFMDNSKFTLPQGLRKRINDIPGI